MLTLRFFSGFLRWVIQFYNHWNYAFPTVGKCNFLPSSFYLITNRWIFHIPTIFNNSILFGFPTVGNSVLQPLELRFSNRRKRQVPTIFFLFNNQPWDITSYNRGKKFNHLHHWRIFWKLHYQIDGPGDKAISNGGNHGGIYGFFPVLKLRITVQKMKNWKWKNENE